jgi:hypothetical protein
MLYLQVLILGGGLGKWEMQKLEGGGVRKGILVFAHSI